MNNDGTTKQPGRKKGINAKEWHEQFAKKMEERGIKITRQKPEEKENTETFRVIIPLRTPKEEKEPWTTDSLKENVIQSQMKHKGLTREEAEEIVSMYL